MKRASVALVMAFAVVGAFAEAPLSKRALVAVRQGPLPSTVSRFASRLEKAEDGRANLFALVRSQLSLPVTIRETAYQKVGASCVRYFHQKQGNAEGELAPSLKRLADAFHKDPIRELGGGVYGVATEEPCSHVASVTLDGKGSKIVTITVDAEDPAWTQARSEFWPVQPK